MAFDLLSERFAEVGLDYPPSAEAEFTDADGLLMIAGWWADLDTEYVAPTFAPLSRGGVARRVLRGF